MGAEAVAKIRGYISPNEIVEFIKKAYDEHVSYGIGIKDYGLISKLENVRMVYDNSDTMKVESGYITFSTKPTIQRSIFYHHQNVNTERNATHYEEIGLGEMVNTEITELRLSADSEATAILMDILQVYGGWLDEDDCDEAEFFEILKV